MPSKDKEKLDKYAVLDRAGLKMVEAFRKYRNVYKAAERAGIAKARAVKVFNSAAFQDELERQEEAVRLERARQEVRDEKLTNEVIDRELMRVVLLDVEKHGSLKLDGIRLGAVMMGRIQAGNTKSLEMPGGGGNAGGAFSYHAVVQVQEAAPILPVAPEQPSPAVAPPEVAVAAAAAVPAVAAERKPATASPVKAKPAPSGAIRLG